MHVIRRSRLPRMGAPPALSMPLDPPICEEVASLALESARLLVLRNRSQTGNGGVDRAVWEPKMDGLEYR